MPMYLALLKVDRTNANDWKKHLNALPEKTNSGIKTCYVANVFGQWDHCIWFEGDNNDHAMDYVQNKLAAIPGVTETYTLPTTPINEHWKTWRK